MREAKELSHWQATTRELIAEMAVTLYPEMPMEQGRFRKLMWKAMYSDTLPSRLDAVRDLEKQRARVYEVAK